MLTTIKPKTKTLILYLCLPVAMFIFTVFVPLVTALVYSFFEWKGGPVKTFNGLANYVQLIHDSTFWQSFGHNIYLVIACIIGQVGIAFILVLMVNAKAVKLKGMHRTFGFFPSTISAVCIGLIWNMIYHNKYGLINLSAISSIDSEIFESAQIDGANGLQTAWYITLPLIKNTMLVCITLCVAGNMKAFDNIYVMTKGGPGTASMVMAMYGYQVSFSQSNMGYGSCISVAIFVLSLLVIGGSQALIKYLTREKEA